MHLRFTVDVELEKTEGKFVARADIADAIIEEAICDPGQIDVDESAYEITSWDVELAEQPRKRRTR